MQTQLAPSEFGAIFNNFKSTAFRLETLGQYLVDEESREYRRFLSGEPVSEDQNREWCGLVRNATTQGKRMMRVRVLTDPMTPYLRFEIYWGYVYSATAGELIYVLDRRHAIENDLRLAGDFWLFDDKQLVLMDYDSNGRFIRGMSEDDPMEINRHCDLVHRLLERSMLLQDYLKATRTA